MDKAQQIAFLVSNCECWKGKADVLNAMADDAVKAVYDSTQTFIQYRSDAEGRMKAVANSLGVDTLPETAQIPNLVKSKITTNVNPPQKPKSFAEALNMYGTAEERSTWETAVRINSDRRNALVEKVVNSMASTDEAKNAIRPLYAKMSNADLETLAKTLPTANSGFGGGDSNYFFPDPHRGNPGGGVLEVNQYDSLVAPCFFPAE